MAFDRLPTTERIDVLLLVSGTRKTELPKHESEDGLQGDRYMQRFTMGDMLKKIQLNFLGNDGKHTQTSRSLGRGSNLCTHPQWTKLAADLLFA